MEQRKHYGTDSFAEAAAASTMPNHFLILFKQQKKENHEKNHEGPVHFQELVCPLKNGYILFAFL